MMKVISGMVPFPTNAESSPFFGALASVMLAALGYSNDTAYYCGRKGTYCVECGDCGATTTLEKHHLQLYHVFQTVTGVGLGWYWPEDPEKAYQVVAGGGSDWDWPDDLIEFIMRVAGLSWQRLRRGDLDSVFSAFTASIDAGFPVLAKLGTGRDWHVVCGYDDEKQLYGLDSHLHWIGDAKPAVQPEGYTDDGLFILSDWHEPFANAIVITGRCAPTVTLGQMLTRMAAALEHPAHGLLEAEIMRRIDDVTANNALETAGWLNDRVSFPIEARWHVADCTDSTLPNMTQVEAVRRSLLRITRQYVFDNDLDATHGTCWKIWSQLGVGPETKYSVSERSAAQLLKPETRAELKRLFSIVFENDRIVLDLLRTAIAGCEASSPLVSAHKPCGQVEDGQNDPQKPRNHAVSLGFSTPQGP